jgi:DNA-binding NarL/FixJ family response regulator
MPVALVIAATPVVRRGLAAILSDAGWSVVDDVGALDSRPGVVVWELPPSSTAADLDVVLASVSGAPVLVLAARATPDVLGALVAAGARGALDRDVDESALAQAVRAVADGRTVVNAGARTDGSGSRPPALTRREAQVLTLLCAGRTNHGIAEALVISDNTVKNHVRRIYEKLQVRSRTEAVVRAARWGLVRIDGDEPDQGAAGGAGPA